MLPLTEMHPICRWPWGGTFSAYTALFVLGYAVGIAWLRSQLRRLPFTLGLFWLMIAVLLTAALAGSKLGYYIVEWRTFRADPWRMIADWRTGWVYWSGFLLAMLAGLFFQAWLKWTGRPRDYLPVADYFAPALALGHAVGRVGCFLAGCCHGRPTSLPWGVVFTNPAADLDDRLFGVPIHPTQLYEAFSEAAAAAVLIGLVLPRIRAGRLRAGSAFLGYILYYSILRFGLEFLRGDDRGFFLSDALSPSQWLSLGAGLAAAWTLKSRGLAEPNLKARSVYAD